jgi:hypothetical protein
VSGLISLPTSLEKTAKPLGETNGLVFFPVLIGELGYDNNDRLDW